MSSQNFHDMIRDKLAALREMRGLTVVKVTNLSKDAETAVLAAGGRVLSRVYVRTCHSDTCACNSHDSGHETATIECPQSWVDAVGGADVDIWDFGTEDRPVLLLPTSPPVLLVNADRGYHYNTECRPCHLRPHAQEVLS